MSCDVPRIVIYSFNNLNFKFKKLMKISSELIKGSTKSLVLSVLNEDDLYGYQIIKLINTKSENAFELGEGTIYPILHGLEKEKFVESYWKKQESAPDRKYYHITEKGKKGLKQSLSEWKDFTKAVDLVVKTVQIYEK